MVKEEICVEEQMHFKCFINTFQIWTKTNVKLEGALLVKEEVEELLVEEEVEEEVCWHLPLPVCSQPLKGGHSLSNSERQHEDFFGQFL